MLVTTRNISVSISPCETAIWDPINGNPETSTAVGFQVSFFLNMTVNNKDAALMTECKENNMNYGDPVVTFAYEPVERILPTTIEGENIVVVPVFGDSGEYTLIVSR